MYTNILNQIENAFYEGFSDNSFKKLSEGYVGPLEIKEEEDFYSVKKVIVGFGSDKITANVRKSILKVSVDLQEDRSTEVVSLRIDPDYIDVSKISSKLKNGILEVRLPKSENSKTVEISVE